MLDERGVEWTANDGEYVKETCWTYMGELTAAFAEYNDGTTRFACDTWCFTTEQAIAVTLGAGTCKVESSVAIEFDTLISTNYYEFEMKCGYRFSWSDNEPPDYCPGCGRKVVHDGG